MLARCKAISDQLERIADDALLRLAANRIGRYGARRAHSASTPGTSDGAMRLR